MNVFANLIGQIIPLLAGLVLIPPTLHALGTARFGVLAIAWSLLTIAAVVEHAMSRTIVRELARQREAPIATRTVLLIGAAIGASLGIAAALLLHDVQLLALGLIVPPTLAFALNRSRLEAERRFIAAATLRMFFSLATFVIPWLVAVHGNGSFALMFLGIAAARALLAGPLRFAAIPARASFFRFTTGIMVVNVMPAAAAALDRWLIGALSGIAAVTPFGIAAEIFTRAMIVPASVTIVAFPAAAAGETIFSMRRAIAGVACITIVVTVTVAAGPLLLHEWLGADVGDQVAKLIPPFLACFLCVCAGTLPAVVLQARGKLAPLIRTRLVIALLVAVQPLLIARWGAEGAAWGVAVRYACDAAALAFLAQRE